MAKLGRNDKCPCGSGLKIKRCCGVSRGPSEAALAKAFLSVEARAAAIDLVTHDEVDLAQLYHELLDLPERDLTLLVQVPEFVTPEVARLFRAVADVDPDATDAALPAVMKRIDTPVTRAGLARAIIALRDSRRLDRALAAAALIDLDSPSSALLRASLIQSVLVEVGQARTPMGLIVGV